MSTDSTPSDDEDDESARLCPICHRELDADAGDDTVAEVPHEGGSTCDHGLHLACWVALPAHEPVGCWCGREIVRSKVHADHPTSVDAKATDAPDAEVSNVDDSEICPFCGELLDRDPAPTLGESPTGPSYIDVLHDDGVRCRHKIHRQCAAFVKIAANSQSGMQRGPRAATPEPIMCRCGRPVVGGIDHRTV